MMLDLWRARTARERILLAGSGVILAALLLVQGVWLPLERVAGQAERARDAAAATLVEVREAARLVTARPQEMPAAGAPAGAEDARGTLIRTARDAGLSITRIEPTPEGLSVWLDAAPAVDLQGWLVGLSTTHDLAVRRASVRGNPDGATVRAQFLFPVGGR